KLVRATRARHPRARPLREDRHRLLQLEANPVAGHDIRPAVIEGDAGRDDETRRAAREVGIGARRGAAFTGEVTARDDLAGAEQDSRAHLLWRADDVRAGVHAVGEVGVEAAG